MVSQEDLVSQFQVELARQFVPLIVVTNGGKDCVVYRSNDKYVLAPPQVQAVDSTGAGDTFATALFIRLHQSGGDIRDAAQFATYLAARSITRSNLAEKIAEIRSAIDVYDKGVVDFG